MNLLNYPQLLQSFVAEIKRELTMRRKVWPRVPDQKHRYTDLKNQSRYDDMRLMGKVFEEMTPRELETIVKRIQAKKKEKESPSQIQMF